MEICEFRIGRLLEDPYLFKEAQAWGKIRFSLNLSREFKLLCENVVHAKMSIFKAMF